MEADRFERVGALFDLARELQGDERARLLDERCEGDADLRAEVESLLAHHAVAASQLDEPLLTPAVEPPPLHSVGPYRLVRRIGAGGMGTVFEAEQTNPDRSIALKLMSPALSSPEMLRRFDQEVQLLGRLEHPCIARIFDAGSAETIHGPQPYFAMELIAGVDLLTYAADRHLDVAARVTLIRRVCEAVHHAHLRGVVHRDLKPANILVDETGNPKILDFGIARAIEADPATRTRLTMTGELVGTVPYMSPEQFTGRTEDIDLRSDVYGLGVVLYELLTGRLPYDFGDVMPHEAVRIVRDGEPRRMSAVHRELRGDIQTIVDKAIAKEPERRYGSAADLSADLGRWLDDEPILARPATTIYQLRKFVRRNRGSLSAATVFVVLLSIFAVAMFFKARENRRLADSEGLAKRDALEALADADTQRDRADATAERLARELRASNIQRGRLLARDGQPISAVQIVWREHLQDPASAHSLWALREIAARHGLLQTHIAHEGSSVTSIAFASRAARLVSSGADGRICLLDSARHASAGYMEMNADVHVLAAHPDGTTVAAGTNAGAIAIIDARSARIVRTLEGEEAVRALAYSGDGFHLAAAGATGTVHLLEASTGMPLGTFDLGTRVVSLCFSPDGASIAAACADATVRLLRPGVSPQVLRAPSPAVHVVFTHDGSHVYAGHEDGRIRTWVTGSGQRLLDTTTGNVNITAMALSTDSRTLVTGGLYSIDVWSTSPLELKRSLPVHRRVEGLAISVRGDFVAAGTIDGTVRVWDLTSKSSEILLGQPWAVNGRFSPDGRFVAAGYSNGAVRIWNRATGELAGELTGHTNQVRSLAYGPGGRHLATGSRDGTVRVWLLPEQRCIHVFDQYAVAASRSVHISPSGDLLAFAGPSAIELRRISTGEPVDDVPDHLPSPEDTPLALQFHPSGESVAWTEGGTLLMRRLDGATVVEFPSSRARELCAFSPDGSLIAATTADGPIEVWRTETGEMECLFESARRSWDVEFHPAGDVLAAPASGSNVRLWSIRERRELLEIGIDGADAWVASFSPDGSSLAVAADRAITLHDLTYYDRHIAGQAEHQIESFADELGARMRADDVRAWARAVRARPWPRFAPVAD